MPVQGFRWLVCCRLQGFSLLGRDYGEREEEEEEEEESIELRNNDNLTNANGRVSQVHTHTFFCILHLTARLFFILHGLEMWSFTVCIVLLEWKQPEYLNIQTITVTVRLDLMHCYITVYSYFLCFISCIFIC